MLYVNWNALDGQQRYKENMTLQVASKLVHDLAVSCVVFEKERENIGVTRGVFNGAVAMSSLGMRTKYLETCPSERMFIAA